MKIPENFYRVSVKALIQDGTKNILLVEDHNENWGFPGGGLDTGETITECLKRELCEEIGVSDITHGDIPEFIYTGINLGGLPQIFLLFKTKIKGSIALGDECENYQYIPFEKLKSIKITTSVQEYIKLFDK